MIKIKFHPAPLLITLSTLFLCQLADAGPWPLKVGSGSIGVSGSTLSATKIIDAQEITHDYAIQQNAVNLFGEVGILKNYSLGYSFTPFHSVTSDSFDTQGWSNLDLAVNQYLGRINSSVFGLEYSTSLPIGKENPASAPKYLYSLYGPKVWSFGFMPEWGLGQGANWYKAGLGFRYRSDDYTAQARYELMGGRHFGESKKFGLRLAFSGIIPFESKTNGKPSDQEQYFGIQIAADWKFNQNWNAFLQGDGMTPPPKEEPLGGRLNLGLIYSFMN